MNLPDLLRRSDRAVKIVAGQATPTVLRWAEEPRSVVVTEPGTELLLQRADEFLCLNDRPRDIGWRIWQTENGNGEAAFATFVVDILKAECSSHYDTMFRTSEHTTNCRNITLDWPQWAHNDESFHIRLRNDGAIPMAIDTGLSFNSRAKFFPLIQGNGVEIGPGLNPHILPSDKIDVRYVESASAEEWVRNYKKTDKPSIVEQKNLWSKYIVADAQFLATIPDGSLDFIYSNHVFEHLMNPLGVLENWRRKLSPSGLIVGVVPDCRYTFDLRQFPSTSEDWHRQRSEGIWKTGLDQYERWCKYTAPYNTPENLIARNYSIHVHYYTPDTFAELGNLVVREGYFDEILMETSPNHKDFGFLLRVDKRAGAGT